MDFSYALKNGCALALFALSFIFFAGCHKAASRDNVVTVPAEDAAMNAEMEVAMNRARSEVDKAIAMLQSGKIESFSVKIPITDGGETEYFWLNEVVYENGSFSGAINNDPEMVHNVKFGERKTVKKDQISDWLYMQDNKMHGNYTLRVLFKQMPPDEVAKYQKIMVDQ